MTKVIARNSTVPIKQSELFSTAEDNQPDVEINVLQGEREFAKDNKSLGTFVLTGIPEAASGTPQIEVTFDINVDGLLSVKAKELRTNIEQSITIKDTSNLEQNEIEKILSEEEKYASDETEARKGVELKFQAKALVSQAEDGLKDIEGDANFESETLILKEKIQNLQDMIKSEGSLDDIQQTTEDLKEAMKTVLKKKGLNENNQ